MKDSFFSSRKLVFLFSFKQKMRSWASNILLSLSLNTPEFAQQYILKNWIKQIDSYFIVMKEANFIKDPVKII